MPNQHITVASQERTSARYFKNFKKFFEAVLQDFLQGDTAEASSRVSAESPNAHPSRSVPSGVSPGISVGVPSGNAPEV